MTTEKGVRHYLVSMPIAGGHVHCYVMSNDKDAAVKAGQRMLYEVEQKAGPINHPMMCATRLSPAGVELVRMLIVENSPRPEVAELLRSATDFHLSIFFMMGPADAELVALH